MNSREIFIYPTDTVWGIGASINSKEENDQIRIIKRSKPDKPLSVLFPSFEMLKNSLGKNLPLSEMALVNFFKLESTMLIPLEYFKLPLDKAVIGESSHVGIRCLSFPFLPPFPITSTSLNLSGESPITNYADACTFAEKYFSNAKILYGKSIATSGSSSSIFILSGRDERVKPNFTCLRRGRYVSQLEEILGLD